MKRTNVRITCTGNSKVSNIRVGTGSSGGHVVIEATDGAVVVGMVRSPWYTRLWDWVKALFA